MKKQSVSYYVLGRCLFSLSLKSAKLCTSKADSLSISLNPLKLAENSQLRKLTEVSVFVWRIFNLKEVNYLPS